LNYRAHLKPHPWLRFYFELSRPFEATPIASNGLARLVLGCGELLYADDRQASQEDKSMKTILTRTIALIFVIFLLASCGGSGTSAPAPSAPTTLTWGQGNWGEVNWQ